MTHFRCACQVLLVSVGCVSNVVTRGGETLHGVSVVSIQGLAGINKSIPTRKTRSHSHPSMLKIQAKVQDNLTVTSHFLDSCRDWCVGLMFVASMR